MGIFLAGLVGKDLGSEHELGSNGHVRVLLDLALCASSARAGIEVPTFHQRKAKFWCEL